MIRTPAHQVGPRGTVLIPTLATLALGLGVLTLPSAQAAPAKSGYTALATAASASELGRFEVVHSAAGEYTLTWAAKGRHWVSASTQPDGGSSWKQVGTSNNGVLTVSGLAADRRWYFRIDPNRSGKHGAVSSTRALDLDSSKNTRDLGGYRTADGRTVAWGKLFRTEAITQPTARDAAVLEELGLVRSLDFRSAGEIASKGRNRYPASVDETWTPLLDPSTDALSLAIQAVLGGGDPSAVDALLGAGKAWDIALTGPTKMSRSPIAREAFGNALRQLADEGAVIFNCTAGKDRTGVFGAILLRTLGVPETAVVEDYVLSNVYRRQHNEGTYRVLTAAGVDIELIRPLLEQQPQAIQNMLDAITAEYGSFEQWLDAELGVDATTVAKLRATLLV